MNKSNIRKAKKKHEFKIGGNKITQGIAIIRSVIFSFLKIRNLNFDNSFEFCNIEISIM